MVSLYWLIDLPTYITFIYSSKYYQQYPLITIVYGIRIILDVIFKIFDSFIVFELRYHINHFKSSIYSRLIIYSYTILHLSLYISTIICCIIERHIGLYIITINLIIDILLTIIHLVIVYVLLYIQINNSTEISDTTSKIIDASKPDECLICREEYTIGEKIKKLKCDHLYHIKCIDDWFNRINKVECPFHCT